jgi:ammonium transporter, Amt family
MMRETGSIKMHNNSTILLKTILVISISSLSFFFMGYGLASEVGGGLLGDDKFAGENFNSDDYCRFLYFVALCVKMSVIATGSIGERVAIDTYIFFSFLTSCFIFPLGLAWCWNDGWLQNLGFVDYGGVSIVHVMGGLAGYMGTLIIGPRVGLFSSDSKLRYILDE